MVVVAELSACLEIFYGFVARLLQPTFTTKWAWPGLGSGLGWAGRVTALLQSILGLDSC